MKSLSNHISLKVQLFGFKMDMAKSLENNLDELNKMKIEFTDSGEDLSYKNQAIILLNYVP